MAFRLADLTGRRFGSWVVEAKDPAPNSAYKAVYWLVKCDCGNEGSVRGTELINGRSQRCRPCGIKIWQEAGAPYLNGAQK